MRGDAGLDPAVIGIDSGGGGDTLDAGSSRNGPTSSCKVLWLAFSARVHSPLPAARSCVAS